MESCRALCSLVEKEPVEPSESRSEVVVGCWQVWQRESVGAVQSGRGQCGVLCRPCREAALGPVQTWQRGNV